jgi:hypothetical protein
LCRSSFRPARASPQDSGDGRRRRFIQADLPLHTLRFLPPPFHSGGLFNHRTCTRVFDPTSNRPDAGVATLARRRSCRLLPYRRQPRTASRLFAYLSATPSSQVWIKGNGEMPFLYGNHIVKAHLGKTTEDIVEHQGVVIYSMSDVPLVSRLRPSEPAWSASRLTGLRERLVRVSA